MRWGRGQVAEQHAKSAEAAERRLQIDAVEDDEPLEVRAICNPLDVLAERPVQRATCQETTAIAVLQRAVAWFADRGVTVEQVLSDNGSCYRSYAWADACTELDIRHRRTRPYRPQTNGKIERFHRTLGDGWAYARF